MVPNRSCSPHRDDRRRCPCEDYGSSGLAAQRAGGPGETHFWSGQGRVDHPVIKDGNGENQFLDSRWSFKKKPPWIYGECPICSVCFFAHHLRKAGISHNRSLTEDGADVATLRWWAGAPGGGPRDAAWASLVWRIGRATEYSMALFDTFWRCLLGMVNANLATSPLVN